MSGISKSCKTEPNIAEMLKELLLEQIRQHLAINYCKQ